MGIPVLILGESGTGKSTSIRNFTDDEISIINVDGKRFPFKKNFSKVIKTDNANEIKRRMLQTKSKVIVIDDAQYIMANEFMRKRGEKGFEKFTDIGGNYFDIIEQVKSLPDDVIVYFLSHVEETPAGTVKAKTIGKMLDEKITIEGKFTVVLRTLVRDGEYFFTTQNTGYDTVKTPMGMFKTEEIPNDLKAVDIAIREYWGINKEDK